MGIIILSFQMRKMTQKEIKSQSWDSNPRPSDCKACAAPKRPTFSAVLGRVRGPESSLVASSGDYAVSGSRVKKSGSS